MDNGSTLICFFFFQLFSSKGTINLPLWVALKESKLELIKGAPGLESWTRGRGGG